MHDMPYPPSLPLYVDRIYHSRTNEEHWAMPIVFRSTLILTTVLFLIGLLFRSEYLLPVTRQYLHPPWDLITTSLIPPVILCLVLILTPALTSPISPYATMLARNPQDRRARWNLAVIASAHIYYGHIAQSEWFSLLIGLSTEERFKAYTFVQRVRRALQRIPAMAARDIGSTIIAMVLVIILSLTVFRFSPFEAILHSLALTFVLQLLMLYIYVQRWQHIRRLLEIEDVFEELLPGEPPAEEHPVHEDPVQQWAHEQESLRTAPAQRPAPVAPPPAAPAPPPPAPAAEPASVELPPAPWE